MEVNLKEGVPDKTLPTPGVRTRARIDEARARNQQRPVRTSMRHVSDDPGDIGAPHGDLAGWSETMTDTFGTTSSAFMASELGRVVDASREANQKGLGEIETNAVLAAIEGARPKDEIEAMLASKMVVTHRLAMTMLGRTRRADYLEHMDRYGNLAVKLLRTFTAQAEALAKLRRGGEQTVRVEHVHVHQGGQAIVGRVTAAGGGGGGMKSGDQPHEPEPRSITHEPGEAMPGDIEAERQAVPVSGG